MRKAMIDSFVSQLTTLLRGLRTPIKEDELQRLYDDRNYAGMVYVIQQVLGLDLKLELGLVRSGGPKNAPAWVELLKPMPVYGTLQFRQSTIQVFMRNSFLASVGFEVVVIAIAHELCHIVLSSIDSHLFMQEEAVDLSAMMLGFRDFYTTATGKKHYMGPPSNDIFVERYGYLSADEIWYAAQLMTFGPPGKNK